MTAGRLMFSAGSAGVGSPEIDDGDRRQNSAVRFGRVEEVDYAQAKARVKSLVDRDDDTTGRVSGWIKFGGSRAGASREWSPPVVGEEVVILSASGEEHNAVIMPLGLFNDENPQNGDKQGLWRKTFPDGSVIEFDHDSAAFLVDAKRAALRVGGNEIAIDEEAITLNFGGVTVKIDGSGLAVTGGTITHDGRVIDKDHRHKDVQPGGGISGTPQ